MRFRQLAGRSSSHFALDCLPRVHNIGSYTLDHVQQLGGWVGLLLFLTFEQNVRIESRVLPYTIFEIVVIIRSGAHVTMEDVPRPHFHFTFQGFQLRSFRGGRSYGAILHVVQSFLLGSVRIVAVDRLLRSQLQWTHRHP